MNHVRLESVDSTNSYIRRTPSLLAEKCVLVSAREQTSGRGRDERSWYSRPGLDLTFSMSFRTDCRTSDVPAFTAAAGVSLYRAVRPLVGEGLFLKWPNDLYFKGRKLSGILCEFVQEGDIQAVIVGIGINVRAGAFCQAIATEAVSLEEAAERSFELDSLLYLISSRLRDELVAFSGQLDKNTCEDWIEFSDRDRVVMTEMKGVLRSGYIAALNPDASLRIQDAETGQINNYRGEVFYAGER